MGGSKKKHGHAVPQTLAEARKMHAKRLEKAERALTRLEKQRQKLTVLETELAVLAHRHADELLHKNEPDRIDASELERVYVIANPTSKRLADGELRMEEIVEALRAVGILAEIGLKTSGKVARLMARAAVERGDPLLIVAGGDGTLCDVATELIGSCTRLGILPAGTMNNLAHALDVPLDLHAACRLLAMGVTRAIDIGRIVRPEHDPVYFLETAGVGLSALAAALGQDWEKGRWAALFGALGNFFAFKTAHVTIVTDTGEEFQVETDVVTLSNSPFFGKQIPVAPMAKMDDGLLDLAIYEGMSKIDLERYFLEVYQGRPVDEPRIRRRRVRTVRIAADEPLAANAGLDVLGEQSTWAFEVVPRAFSVVVGNSAALTLPVDSAVLEALSGPKTTQAG